MILALCLSLTACGARGETDNQTGLSQYQKGAYQEALASFDKAVEAAPDCAEYRLNRGMTKIALSDYEAADADLTEALRLAPEEAQVFRAMGILRLSQENYGEAVTYFDSALNAAEKNNQTLKTDLNLYKAEAQLKNGDAAGAATTYGEVIAANQNAADYYLLRGRAELQAGDQEAAEADFEQAAKRSGESGEELSYIHYQTAETYLEQENYEEAKAELSAARDGAGEALLKLIDYAEAAVYEYEGDYQTALEKFTAYRDAYGSDETLEHEITFINSRIQEQQ